MNPKDMMVADANAAAMGIPKSSLMENAGRCIADKVSELSKPCKVRIFAGTGGNGGDGFVAARHLLNRGFEVEVVLLSHPSRIKSDEALGNWEVLKKIGYLNPPKIQVVTDSSQLEYKDFEVVIDAILGTGVHGKLREPVSSAVDIINSSNGIKIAVDIPSGLDPLTGEVSDKSVNADFTVTFHRAKTGLKKAEKLGNNRVGELKICDIGLPREAEVFTGPGDLLRLKGRDETSHKGQNGRVLVVGGSADYSGAPALAAMASLASGSDLSYVACPASVASSIRSYSPDLIVKTLKNNVSEDHISFEDVESLTKLSSGVDAVVVGCGMGKKDETALALNELVVKVKKPFVVDADALKLLDMDAVRRKGRDKGIILTPHAAEFKEVFGLNAPKNLEERIETVKEASESSGCTILLKGAADIVCDAGRLRLNATGNSGMTVGGTGDVLAGIVGGLMAQGHDAYEAAYLGAYINGRAGDIAASEYGYSFRATDILKFIPAVLKKN